MTALTQRFEIGDFFEAQRLIVPMMTLQRGGFGPARLALPIDTDEFPIADILPVATEAIDVMLVVDAVLTSFVGVLLIAFFVPDEPF